MAQYRAYLNTVACVIELYFYVIQLCDEIVFDSRRSYCLKAMKAGLITCRTSTYRCTPPLLEQWNKTHSIVSSCDTLSQTTKGLASSTSGQVSSFRLLFKIIYSFILSTSLKCYYSTLKTLNRRYIDGVVTGRRDNVLKCIQSTRSQELSRQNGA